MTSFQLPCVMDGYNCKFRLKTVGVATQVGTRKKNVKKRKNYVTNSLPGK